MKLENLKTFEDACKVLRLDPKKVLPKFTGYPKADVKAMIAHAKLVIIARAANRIANNGKDWKPDWTNGQWDKYYPWFYLGGSSGFRYYDCVSPYSLSLVGSRLCFKSYDVAKYVGETFMKLYEEYFVMK